MKSLNIIVAVDEAGGFAKGRIIPWIKEPFAKEDLKHFKQITNGGACIMGRNTYNEMYDMVVASKLRKKKDKSSPVVINEILPGRDNYVISKSLLNVQGAIVKPELSSAIQTTKKNAIFILGGYRLFIQALPRVNRVYMTIVPGTYECTRFFPLDYLKDKFRIVKGETFGKLKFITYQRMKK